MEIKKLILGPLQTNCYVVINQNECIIIDPATNSEKILNFATEQNIKIKAILLTHGHFDHCDAVKNLQKTGVKVYCGEFDFEILKNNPKNFGLNITNSFTPDFMLQDGEELNLIGLTIKVIATPGHTNGSLCYLIGNNLFCGDTLFAGGGFGRCDLFSGDFQKIKHSIKEKLFKLDDNINLFCGHGANTKLGEEKLLLTNF